MKYSPDAITPNDLDIAEAPYLGGEFAAFLSHTPARLQGEVEFSRSGAGTYAAKNGASIVPLTGNGADLQAVAVTEIRSAEDVVVRFNVVDEDNGNTTMAATFTAAARSDDQSANFPRGVAVDFVVANGKKVKSITSLLSVTGGDRNLRIQVFQLPEASEYLLVGCTTAKKFNTKSREPKGIDCGMETDAFVKRGKSKAGELSIDAKFAGMHQKLSRFSGKKTTCMLAGLKDGVVLTDRLVFTQYVPAVEIDLPDGDGEAMENSGNGKFVEHLFFTAL